MMFLMSSFMSDSLSIRSILCCVRLNSEERSQKYTIFDLEMFTLCTYYSPRVAHDLLYFLSQKNKKKKTKQNGTVRLIDLTDRCV